MKIRSVLLSLILWIAASYMSTAQATGDFPVHDGEVVVSTFADMTYPLAARLTRTEGIVVVMVKFDADGKVTSATAISGPKNLIEETVSNAKKWRFRSSSRKVAVLVYQFHIAGFCSKGGQLIFSAPNIASVVGCELGGSATPDVAPN